MEYVDALSRIVTAIDFTSIETELQYRQLVDPQFTALAKRLKKSEDDKFTLIEGLAYRKFRDKPRFYIPEYDEKFIVCISWQFSTLRK